MYHKPPGLAVQTSRAGEADLEHELKCHVAKEAPGEKVFIGVVHRLDQPVEGLLVFAKSPKAQAELGRQAAVKDEAGGMVKEYIAGVYGALEPPEGRLEDHIIAGGKGISARIGSPGEAGAKASALSYSELGRSEETQLLRIRLESGRHHQIRLQLSSRGCPILGDRRYGSDAAKAYAEAHSIRNIQLKAVHLSFRHPDDGRMMDFRLEETFQTT